jgi:hypothetical protein
MVVDDLIDLQESFLPMWMRGLRCIGCGNIVDPLIHHHRMIQKSGTARLLNHEVRMPASSRPVRAA